MKVRECEVVRSIFLVGQMLSFCEILRGIIGIMKLSLMRKPALFLSSFSKHHIPDFEFLLFMMGVFKISVFFLGLPNTQLLPNFY